ncbi:Zinc finger protein 512B, partial [Merops nubicus]
CCEAIYSSVSGLKAHLANCNKVGPSFYSPGSEVGRPLTPLSPPPPSLWVQNWFRTSSEASRKKKSREQLSSSKEEKKKSTNGKKRGRKPKERPPEPSPKGRESVA